MKFLQNISTYISKAEKAILIMILSLMVILSFLQVVLRNIFGTGILWLDPLLRHFVLWITFLGASIATQNDRHINIDVLSKLLSDRNKYLVKFIIHLFSTLVVFFMLDASIKFIKDEIDANTIIFTISNTEIKSYQMQLIIPVGFALILFRFLISSIQNLRNFIINRKTAT